MNIRLLPLLFTLLAPALQASVQQAEQQLRRGDAAGALQSLIGETGPEADFWRGRALVDLKRMPEAARYLSAVPEEHELYPYAARALLYCAWQSPDVDFATVVPPLATSRNPEIAETAAAALAEFWLQQPQSQDNTALELLRGMTDKHPEFIPVLHLLEVENLRQKGQYADAIQLCRKMEDDRSLPLNIRQRVRLTLAEVLYAQEEAAARSGATAATTTEPTSTDTDEEEDPTTIGQVHGKGEETLLHFISTNPESPLLPDAFRRLTAHKAFSSSEFARAKLKEWMIDTEKPYRASMAMLIMQHLLNNDLSGKLPLDNSCANSALAMFPNEPPTQLILLEQTRMLLERGQTKEAELYLSQVTGNFPRKDFYRAWLSADSPSTAARLFLQSAEVASGELRPVAFANALLCAMRCGDTEMEQDIMQRTDLAPEIRAEVLAMRALFNMEKNPALARECLEQLRALQLSPNSQIDVRLDTAWMSMSESPLTVAQELENMSTDGLTPHQLLRYYALREEALRQSSPPDRRDETENLICERIARAADKAKNAHVRGVLNIHLANRLSLMGRHAEAYVRLTRLHNNEPLGEFAQKATFLSAREKEYIGTLSSLKEAADIYAACAEKYPEMKNRATIHRAQVLIRINRGEEAEQLLRHLLSKEEELPSIARALTYITLSNKYTLEGTPSALQQAMEASGKCIEVPGLPRLWQFTGLLHHGAICARANAYEAALTAYRKLLAMHPAPGRNPESAELLAFHRAATGAITALLELKRYEEAADMADELSRWDGAPGSLERYAKWADFIRQTHFIQKPTH
ncbi:MAG: hypothetical protein IJE66_04160 [Akkermansia sp.]|nr:hypothetical protein [Akkermansia sp.]